MLISRELAPTDPAVLTVGSTQFGCKGNVNGDNVLELNVRTFNNQTRIGVFWPRSGAS